MKSIPMIFNQEMVKALVDGRKTVTRRPVEVWRLPVDTIEIDSSHPESRYMSIASNHSRWGFGVFGATPEAAMENYNGEYKSCAPYNKGDLIWVRENFKVELNQFYDLKGEYALVYGADDGCNLINPNDDNNDKLANLVNKKGLTPSIHMPRWASRLTLRVTNVRCERIQNITDESAIKEGLITKEHRFSSMEYPLGDIGYMVSQNSNDIYSCPVAAYKDLWNSIYSNWHENPWVWVVEFEVIHKNIDKVIKGDGNV